MFTEKQLEQLQKLFQINNKEVLKAISESQKDTIAQVKDMISASQKETIIHVKGMIGDSQRDTIREVLREVRGMISGSQKDTIEVLLDAIHTGYNLHDKRIKRLEDEIGLPPLKQ